MDITSFDFDSLTNGKNPFEEKKQSFVDERFYKLSRDQDDRGAAIIRFLPDPDMNLIQTMYRININSEKNGERRWYSDWSPQSINKPDPFHEEWQRLWNAGEKEKARQFGRQTRYIANIKVIRDPANPDNEGKIFLLDMSQSLKDIVQDALMPSNADVQLGKTPKQLFNPIKGNSFRLVSKRGSNGFITYEASGPVDEVNGIYESADAAKEDIMKNCYRLSSLLEESNFSSYEELKEKLDFVMFRNGETKSPSCEMEVNDVGGATQPKGPEVGKESINDFLDSLS